MNRSIILSVMGLGLCLGLAGSAFGQSSVEDQIRKVIMDGNEYVHEHLQDQAGTYSKDGALEFWSSGGLLNEISGTGRGDQYDSFNAKSKYIRVISLADGQVAVAMYYSEGSFKPKGYPAVDHYLTRVTQVFVKEGGKWKVRASHWSPVTGGSGTSQTSEMDE